MAPKSGEPIIKKVKNTSVATPEDTSIYKKKYYKVVLHAIDPNKETIESFSIKMSIRLRTPMPRVKQILKKLPCTIKTGMNVSQANKLFAVMEELGAKVTVEAYYLKPGKSSDRPPAVAGLATKSTQIGTSSSFNCPSCGWENVSGSDHCPLCLEIFRRPQKSGPNAPGEACSAQTPPEPAPPAPDESPAGFIIIRRRWIALAAALFLLVLSILLLK